MTSDTRSRRADGGLTRKGARTRQRIVAAAADLVMISRTESLAPPPQPSDDPAG